MKLVIDRWKGNRNQPQEVHGPSWGDVEYWVGRLDGQLHTQLCLERQGCHILIGGGPERFNACITTWNEEEERFFTLTNPTGNATDQIGLVAGGQLGLYPANTVVELGQVMTALRVFFESGNVDSDQAWEER